MGGAGVGLRDTCVNMPDDQSSRPTVTLTLLTLLTLLEVRVSGKRRVGFGVDV